MHGKATAPIEQIPKGMLHVAKEPTCKKVTDFRLVTNKYSIMSVQQIKYTTSHIGTKIKVCENLFHLNQMPE